MKVLNILKKMIPKGLFKVVQPIYHFVFSWVAAAYYRHPSDELIVIGVTGTTGKTTSAYIMAKMLEEMGYKTGFTSTAMFNDGEREWMNDKKMTMIGRFFTQKILRDMVKNGCKFAIVETTSEGIEQFRHRYINYDIVVITGLYPEHIESHGSFENYKKAKGKLFAYLKECNAKFVDDDFVVKKTDKGLKKIVLKRVKKTIIGNGEDEHVEYFMNFWAEKKYSFCSEKCINLGSDVRNVNYGDIKMSASGTSFRFGKTEVDLQLLGDFNVVNAMTAVCVGLSLHFDEKDIKRCLEEVKGVAGRLERIDEGQDFIVIVDYAFEPNAVKGLYKTIEAIPHGKVIHVLGSAGGGRDASRRPVLGELAGKGADYVIVTNEDPYDEDPEVIISQVGAGVEKSGKKKGEGFFEILDREEAIRKAFSLAEVGDLVMITGKGNEQAICVKNGEMIEWDDRVVCRKILRKIGKK